MIADFNSIRQRIDETVTDYQNLVRIFYLFGLRVSEIRPKEKGGEGIKGRNFREGKILGEDALILAVPTKRQDGKSWEVAVPLNPRHEPWSKIILDISEDSYDKDLFKGVIRTIQDNIPPYFEGFDWIEVGYRRNGVWIPYREKPIQTKHLKEIREWELAYSHNFSAYEIKNYFRFSLGTIGDMSYFGKLLNRSNIYTKKDIIESIILKQKIFNPVRDGRFNYNNYMTIQKQIKKGFIKLLPQSSISVDTNIKPSPKMSDKMPHRILKANVMEILINKKGSKKIHYEKSNIDVVSHDLYIAVECGHSNGDKLLDVFNDVFIGINNIEELWIVDFYDSNNVSLLYIFKRL